MPRSFLDLPVAKADPRLHELLRRQADHLLDELPKGETVASRVREVVSRELAKGDPSAASVAKRLAMSTSTLARRLETEGTSFREVVDDFRRDAGIRYVQNPKLTLTEIALLLGFSRSSAFYRAFRRWTGQTPLQYRRWNPR